ncbi:Hsp20/alpha crystallin family protein [Bacillus sp. S/N-304-OC-R1]|uniref:Hsp20/alpha crystallin family protein n=1 Tax=Bacillus sp. S/N-304-OC-R1 TaxID=2758034 RepID=UPI001C8EF73B|nr:Hsp20/alpha crystallin family protein [Bacillus sp. S/N-304-OC-R1]MBY0120483.1 Hsp20/alpha crystallin family protein [Bacillus sp. S/N-304-OC-R1]
MDFDKLKQWMELAKSYQTGDFWSGMLDQSSFNQFMKENMEMGASEPSRQRTIKNQFPNIDIYINDLEVIVIADLPGYKKEDLHVSVSGNKLLLKGSTVPIVAGEAVLQERIQGQFQRVVELPEATDSDQIKAKFQNGVLTLTYKRKYIQEEKVIID